MNFIKIKWLRWIAIVLSSCLLIIACAGQPQNSDRAQTLTVAIEPAFPPFEMIDKENGGLKGFSVDLMKAIGKQADLSLEFTNMNFDGIILALQSRQVDAGISSITITPQRAKIVSFSRPYFRSGLAIAVQDSTQNINGLQDLENQKIAVQIGTTGEKAARKIPGAKISTFDSAPLALLELNNGNVKAVINDAPVTLYAINTGNLQGIKIVGQLVTEEYYGIALPKNSSHLDDIDRAIKALIENGTYATIYRKWFEANPPSLPEIAPVLQGK